MIPRQEWLAMLAKLVSPADPVKAGNALLAYRPFLADVPDQAFTSASLEHVAMQPRRLHIPDLSEVKGPLNQWWRDNRPRPALLAAPERPVEREADSLTPEQRKAIQDGFRTLLAGMAPAEPKGPHTRAHVIHPEVLAKLRAEANAKLGRAG